MGPEGLSLSEHENVVTTQSAVHEVDDDHAPYHLTCSNFNSR